MSKGPQILSKYNATDAPCSQMHVFAGGIPTLRTLDPKLEEVNPQASQTLLGFQLCGATPGLLPCGNDSWDPPTP